MNLGATELLLILGIALLLFGPSKLPGLGKSLGEAIRGFKKGLNEDETLAKARPLNENENKESEKVSTSQARAESSRQEQKTTDKNHS